MGKVANSCVCFVFDHSNQARITEDHRNGISFFDSLGIHRCTKSNQRITSLFVEKLRNQFRVVHGENPNEKQEVAAALVAATTATSPDPIQSAVSVAWMTLYAAQEARRDNG
jgi:hypothetical protein